MVNPAVRLAREARLRRAPHVPRQGVFLDEPKLQSGASVDRQAIPFEVRWHGNVNVDCAHGQQLVLDDAVQALARASRDTGLAVEIQPLGKSHRRDADIQHNAVLREGIYSDAFREGPVQHNIICARQHPTAGNDESACDQRSH